MLFYPSFLLNLSPGLQKIPLGGSQFAFCSHKLGKCASSFSWERNKNIQPSRCIRIHNWTAAAILLIDHGASDIYEQMAVHSAETRAAYIIDQLLIVKALSARNNIPSRHVKISLAAANRRGFMNIFLDKYESGTSGFSYHPGSFII